MPKSIQLRIIFFITFFAMLILTASGVYDYHTTKKTMKDSLEKNAVDICNRLAQNLASPLWDMAEAQVDRIMLSEMAEERIFAIIATTPDDSKVTYAKKRNEKWEPQSIKETVKSSGFDTRKEITTETGKIGNVQVVMTSKFMDQALRSRVINIIVTAVLISMVIVITVSITTNKLIIRRVNMISGGLKQIAEGDADLTKRLDIGTDDEIGLLASFFNKFIEKLQLLILSAKQNAASINMSSVRLAGLAAKMSDNAKKMSRTSSIVAGGAEEMNINVNSVTIAMNEASSNLGLVAASTEEMTVTITEIAKNTGEAKRITENAVREASTASSRISELGIAAKGIGQVTEVINEISEQTNLLALNATIEAARAGEAGKGFAVVANEIKELAKQTSEATNEIRARIHGIQTSTEKTVEDIGKVTKVINSVDDIVSSIAAAVEEQSVTTRDIAQNVNHLSSGFVEVNNRLTESSDVISQIAKEIVDVSRLASDFTASSDEVNNNAEALTNLAVRLDEIVGRFNA